MAQKLDIMQQPDELIAHTPASDLQCTTFCCAGKMQGHTRQLRLALSLEKSDIHGLSLAKRFGAPESPCCRDKLAESMHAMTGRAKACLWPHAQGLQLVTILQVATRRMDMYLSRRLAVLRQEEDQHPMGSAMHAQPKPSLKQGSCHRKNCGLAVERGGELQRPLPMLLHQKTLHLVSHRSLYPLDTSFGIGRAALEGMFRRIPMRTGSNLSGPGGAQMLVPMPHSSKDPS